MTMTSATTPAHHVASIDDKAFAVPPIAGHGTRSGLAVILVGEDPATIVHLGRNPREAACRLRVPPVPALAKPACAAGRMPLP